MTKHQTKPDAVHSSIPDIKNDTNPSHDSWLQHDRQLMDAAFGKGAIFRLVMSLPTNQQSRFAGWVFKSGLFSKPLMRLMATKFNIDPNEMERPIDFYDSTASLFTRNLREGVRPIGEGFVSPVDGRLRDIGRIENGRIPQVKGWDYKVEDLLGSTKDSKMFLNGSYANFYLSPKDYHHIHSPVSGVVTKSVHIPGALYPVNDWSVTHIKDVFPKNERLITYLKSSEFGTVAVVKVGALHVGSITVTYDNSIITNLASIPPSCSPIFRDYQNEIIMNRGERLGTFHLGSSVVVLFQNDCRLVLNDETPTLLEKPIKYGKSLGS